MFIQSFAKLGDFFLLCAHFLTAWYFVQTQTHVYEYAWQVAGSIVGVRVRSAMHAGVSFRVRR